MEPVLALKECSATSTPRRLQSDAFYSTACNQLIYHHLLPSIPALSHFSALSRGIGWRRGLGSKLPYLHLQSALVSVGSRGAHTHKVTHSMAFLGLHMHL
jgi:hypothetical protein